MEEVQFLKVLKKMDPKKVVRAIEDDAGRALPGLRRFLEQVKASIFSQSHTPEQIIARRRSLPKRGRVEVRKETIEIWLDSDVSAALRASGNGWQSRVNRALRASLALCEKTRPL
jgi:uncharacterized protein (DUF4415 family)